MRKLTILAIVFLFIISGCQKQPPIKIGFAGGITGTNSSLSISGRNAVLLAVDELNKAGGIAGRPVEVIIMDDREDPDTAAQVDLQLIDEGAAVIIGHYVSSVANTSLNAISDKNVIMISPTISASDLSGRDDNFFRVILKNSDQGKALANYAFGDVGNTKTYIVYNAQNKAFVDGVTTSYRESFENQGGEIVGSSAMVSKDADSAVTVVNDAVAKGADSILSVMNARDLAMFAQQLHRMGKDIPVYSATWGMTSDVISQGGTASEGIVFPALFDTDSQAPEFLAFKTKYEQLYVEPIDFSSLYSYETAQILFEALRESDPDDSDAIKESILRIRVFEGLQSELRFDTYGDIQRPQFITTVQDGKFKTIRQVD